MSKKPLKVIAGTPDRPLIIGDVEIPCYVLEDETRVLSQRGMAEGIGLSIAGSRLPRMMDSKSLKPFISKDLLLGLDSPMIFTNPGGGGVAYGYPATLLVNICNAILEARDAGMLKSNQMHISRRADILMRGLATVGIIALVDEATGYQQLREERALATILEKFIAKELQPWTKTFPYEFYKQIFRLKGWAGPTGVKKPSVIGHYTNDFVYSRIAHGILEELKTINPTIPTTGRRKTTHHQWFTPDLGHPKLKEHLAAVTALMRAAPNWDSFKRSLQRALPKLNKTMNLPFNE